MSFIAKRTRVYVGAYDISGDARQATVADAHAELDAMVFTSEAGKAAAGIPTPTVDINGFVTFGSGSVWETLRGHRALSGVPITVVPDIAQAVPVALFVGETLQTNLNTGAPVGQILPFTVNAKAEGKPLVYGFVGFNDTSAASGSFEADAIQLGAIPAGKRLHAVLHVLEGSGSLTVAIESDSAEAFDDDPTERIAFAEATEPSYEYARTDGSAIAHPYYRVTYTVTGGPMRFVVAIGIA